MRPLLVLGLSLACTLPAVRAQQQWSATKCHAQYLSIPAACCAGGVCEDTTEGGIPTSCTRSCARVYKPIWWKCRKVMAAEGQAPEARALMQKCMAATGSTRPLPGGGRATAGSGGGGDDGEGNTYHPPPTPKGRSKTCCENRVQWLGKAVGTPVCGFSPKAFGAKCYAKAIAGQAASICKSQGARLCSKAELMAGEASATGCGHDQRPVWSGSTCGGGRFWSVQVRGTQDQATCLPCNTPMAVRCCADYCNKNKIPAGKGGDGGGGDNHHGGGNQHKKRCAGGKPCNKGHALPPTLPPPAKAMGGQPYGTDPNTAAGPIPPGAKNVLMIVIDDWRTEIKSLYGRSYIHTPNIDKFMQTSVGFTKAYVQQAICGATRASFLTGRRPETTRIYDLHHYWREVAGDFVSIPQHFAENGYVTRGFGKLMHPVCGAQIEQPGECDPKAWTLPYFHSKTEKHWTCNSRTVKQKNHASKGCFYAQNSYKTVMPSEEAQYPLSDTMSAKTAAAQLQSFRTAGEARPFFLGVGYHKPHLPFTVPKRHVDKYPLSSIPAARNPFAPWDLPEVAWSAYGELRNYPDIQTVDNENTQRGWGGYGGVGSKNGKQNPYPNASFPANTARALRQHYFAAVTFADENVGIVLDKLHTTGYDKNTIVILFGDHGWQLGEHSEWCKHTNFDIATNIPLILRVPGLTDRPSFRTRISTSFMELVDVFPTLADFAGIKVPPTCPVNPRCAGFGCSSASTNVRLCTEGQSMRTMVNRCAAGASNCHQGKQASFSVYPRYHGPVAGQTTLKQAMGYSMTTRYMNREYRFTEWVPFDAGGSMDWWKPDVNPGKFSQVRSWCKSKKACGGARELYDHTTDPDENHNLAMIPGYAQVVQTLSARLRQGWRGAMITTGDGGGGH